MVFIDGGHAEETAQQDFEMWSKRLDSGESWQYMMSILIQKTVVGLRSTFIRKP